MWSSLVTIFTTTKLQLLIFFPTFSYCISFFSEFPLLFQCFRKDAGSRGIAQGVGEEIYDCDVEPLAPLRSRKKSHSGITVLKSPLSGCEGVGSVGASRKSRASCGRIVMDLLQSSIPNAFFPSNVLGNICSCRS